MSARLLRNRDELKKPDRLEPDLPQRTISKPQRRARQQLPEPAAAAAVAPAAQEDGELPRWDYQVAQAFRERNIDYLLHRDDREALIPDGENKNYKGMWVLPCAQCFEGTRRYRFRVVFSGLNTYYVTAGLITEEEYRRVKTSDFGSDFSRYKMLEQLTGAIDMKFDVDMQRRTCRVTTADGKTQQFDRLPSKVYLACSIKRSASCLILPL